MLYNYCLWFSEVYSENSEQKVEQKNCEICIESMNLIKVVDKGILLRAVIIKEIHAVKDKLCTLY